ncbi:hypothetical protein, partial [Spirosoma sp.]|uniref:hypothetical protein n=1 Tax=Spirosoma sp. TaxID=1899569 RepID=UPI003B3A29EE
RYRQRSEVRIHTSPVSNLHAWVAGQALQNDRSKGDRLRNQLCQNVTLFKQQVRSVPTTGGLFPVQKLALSNARAVFSVYRQLRMAGIQPLLLTNDQQPTVPEVAFCIRADHPPSAILRTCHQINTILGKDNSTPHPKPNNLIAYEPLADSKLTPSPPKNRRKGQRLH